MLFASARMAPPGGRLTSYSREAVAAHSRRSPRRRARRLDRGRRRQLVGGGARAQGRRPDLLRRANAAGPAAAVRRRARRAATRSDGSAAAIMTRRSRGSRPLAATYYAAPSQHLGLEPLTATARVRRRRLEVWAPTQAPGLRRARDGRDALSDAAGRAGGPRDGGRCQPRSRSSSRAS